jgi:hypothetical protein
MARIPHAHAASALHTGMLQHPGMTGVMVVCALWVDRILYLTGDLLLIDLVLYTQRKIVTWCFASKPRGSVTCFDKQCCYSR